MLEKILTINKITSNLLDLKCLLREIIWDVERKNK